MRLTEAREKGRNWLLVYSIAQRTILSKIELKLDNNVTDALAFSIDGTQLFFTLRDGKANIVDIATGKILRRYTNAGGEVCALADGSFAGQGFILQRRGDGYDELPSPGRYELLACEHSGRALIVKVTVNANAYERDPFLIESVDTTGWRPVPKSLAGSRVGEFGTLDQQGNVVYFTTPQSALQQYDTRSGALISELKVPANTVECRNGSKHAFVLALNGREAIVRTECFVARFARQP
jgi:hypothetical protein